MPHLTLDQCRTLKSLGFHEETYRGWYHFRDAESEMVRRLPAEGDYYFWDSLHKQPFTHFPWPPRETPKPAYPHPSTEKLMYWLGEGFQSLRYGPDDEYVCYGWADENTPVAVSGRDPTETMYRLAMEVRRPEDAPAKADSAGAPVLSGAESAVTPAVTLTCPWCGSTNRQIKRGKSPRGEQAYYCNDCHSKYNPKAKSKRKYPPEVHAKALRLYADGNSFARTAALVGVSYATVFNWVKAH